MTELKINRSKFAMYINTTPATTATYKLVGTGFTTAMINYNPEVIKEAYINQDSNSSVVEKYSPEIPLEGKFITGNDAQDYIETKRRARSTGSNAETDVLFVYLWTTPSNTDNYACEKQPVVIAFDKFGGDGGTFMQTGCTLHGNGDPVQGTFDVSASTFTAS